MDQSKLKNIAFASGLIAILFGGLFYILVTDLLLMNTAQWLFFGIICAFGSAAMLVISETFKHRPMWFYIFKGLGVAFAIGFIVVMFLYVGSVNVDAIVKTKSYTTAKTLSLANMVRIVSLIFGFISIAAQGCGITLNIIYKIDD